VLEEKDRRARDLCPTVDGVGDTENHNFLEVECVKERNIFRHQKRGNWLNQIEPDTDPTNIADSANVLVAERRSTSSDIGFAH